MPHNEIAKTFASRALIEHVTGTLMLVYDLDADNAFELLKWGSQTTDGDLHRLAQQVAHVAADDVAALRAACDDVLFP